MRANVSARRVLPVPVGPIRRTFDFSNSVGSSFKIGIDALVVIVDRDRQRLFGTLLPDHILVQDIFDLDRLGKVHGTVARFPAHLLLPMMSLQSWMHSLQM